MIGNSIAPTIMLGTALLGATAGVIGSFAVLRRRALVGDMLSHAALPGICIAFLLMGGRNFLGLSLGALGAGILGVSVVSLLVRWTRTKEDAAIGIVLSTFFGWGVVLLSVTQQHASGNQAGLDRFMFGETVSITRDDTKMIAVVASACLCIVLLLYKEFQLLSFDSDFAAAQGWPTVTLDLVMMGTLAVVTVVGLPICGVILMSALVIIPGAAARLWTDHLGRMLIIAATIGAASGVLGTLLATPQLENWLGFRPLGKSFEPRILPPGPLIVLSGAAIFVFSLLVAPRNGLVARAYSEFRLRLRIAREHVLRSLYERSESKLPNLPWIDEDQFVHERTQGHGFASWWLRRLRRQGLVESEGTRVRLTHAGLREAAEVTRTHRLWELFLVESAGIASDHVDRDADDVEHMLPPQLIDRLERRLAELGTLPAVNRIVPESPHELPQP